MFVDELNDAVITDQPWQTAANYSHHSNGIDQIELQIG